MAPGPFVAALLKRVDLRPEADPLTGVITHDPHGGLSASDQCALELALQIGESEHLPVRAVTAGGPAADAVLRQALEVGATEVLRVDLSPHAASADIAAALAVQVDGARFVIAGDYSLDRGSGSVPAFVAGHLRCAQVLGSASVQWQDGSLHIERRLDRGRRERVVATAPAVVSVDGGLPPLRRSPLPLVLRSARAEIPVTTHQTRRTRSGTDPAVPAPAPGAQRARPAPPGRVSASSACPAPSPCSIPPGWWWLHPGRQPTSFSRSWPLAATWPRGVGSRGRRNADVPTGPTRPSGDRGGRSGHRQDAGPGLPGRSGGELHVRRSATA